jgi:hypothetical protein
MKIARSTYVLASGAAFFLNLVAGTATAQTLFGTLTNFDVFNDTGQEAYGFEIELEGISSADITSVFGGTFIRYGNPRVVDYPGGVRVRYESSYDDLHQTFLVSTPVPPSITPTAGHSCWTGGAPGYLTSGCEHFGFGLLNSPTAMHSHWLIADPTTLGTLVPYSVNVSIPLPAWNVAPAQPGIAPVVQAAIRPPEAPQAQFGDAVWVKTFETENPEKIELHHLVTGDPVVPQLASEVEVEWEIMQADLQKPDSGVLSHSKPLSDGDHSVIRRYEFYKYTGAYTSEHEVACGGDGTCKSPLPGELGDYIGAQMAAAIIGAAATSVDLSQSAGAASTMSTLNVPPATRTGYAKLTINSGSAPYGTAVFSFVQNDVVVTEAAVPSSTPTTAARIFIDYRSNAPASSGQFEKGSIDIDTGVAVVNPGGTSANVTYTLRSTGGAVLAVGHGSVAAGAHFARFIDQMNLVAPDFNLPADFASATGFGTLELSSDQPLSVLALRTVVNQRGEALFTTTPIADLTRPAGSNALYFPQLADGGGWVTSIILLNTTNAVETGRLTLMTDSGQALVVNRSDGVRSSTFNYSIQPGGAYVFQTDGTPGSPAAGSVQLVPDPGTFAPAGAGVFSFARDGVRVSESGVPAAALTTRARIYVDQSSGHDTGLAVVNPNNAATLSLRAYQSDGITTAGSGAGTLNLSANGHSATFIGSLISGLPANFTGVLDISSSVPFAALTLRSLINSRDDFLVTTLPVADMTRPGPSPIVFPQIADGGGYEMQSILLGAAGASSTTLEFYDDAGSPLPVIR